MMGVRLAMSADHSSHTGPSIVAMSILYSLVGRGDVVLSEYAAATGSIQPKMPHPAFPRHPPARQALLAFAIALASGIE